MTVSARLLADCRQKKTPSAWVLVAALTVFAVAPLAHPSFPQGHSGALPAYKAAHPLANPTWLDDTATLRGEGRLPYLLVWPILTVSGSGFVAAKWGYALSILLAALVMYAWTCRWLSFEGGVVSAAVYTYLPWHLSTVYVRGAYAESWLWVLWPAVLWAIDRIADRRQLSHPQTFAGALVGLFSLAAAFGTHPGLAAISVPFLASYGAVRLAKGRRWAWMAIALALTAGGLSLTARGWLEIPEIAAGDLLYPYQLLTAAWGGTRSLPQSVQGQVGWTKAFPISYQLGLAAVGLSIVAAVLYASRKPDQSEAGRAASARVPPLPRHIFWFWVATALLVILPTLRTAVLLWRATGLGALVPRPWQLLAMAGLPLAFLAGSTIRHEQRLAKLPAWAGLVGLVVLASYPYVAPRFIPTGSEDPGPEPIAVFQSSQTASPQILILAAEVGPHSESTTEPVSLTLTLTWQSLEPVAKDYTVFAHLLAADDQATKIAQQDARPCGGECPTNAWQPGDVIVTSYEFDVPADAPPGPYRFAVGLYLLETGERAAVAGRDDDMVYVDVR